MFSIIIVAFVLLAFASNFVSSTPYSQTFLLVVLLLMIVNTAVSLYQRRKLDVKVLIPRGAEKGSPVSCKLVLENRSKLPVILARVKLQITNGFTEERQMQRIRISAGPSSESSVVIRMTSAHCGKIRCEVKNVSLMDLFGVIPVRCKISGYGNYIALPEIFPVDVSYSPREINLWDCETYSPYRKGMDTTEVFQIREYQPGDNIRQIHWKLSSKLDTLMVKDAGMPLDKNILLMWDKGVSARAHDADRADRMAELTVSIGQSFLEEGISFQVAWNDNDGNGCCIHEIQNQDEFLQCIPQMLAAPVHQGDTSCAEGYCEKENAEIITHIVYITDNQGLEDVAAELFPNAGIIMVDAAEYNYREMYRRIDLA